MKGYDNMKTLTFASYNKNILSEYSNNTIKRLILWDRKKTT